MKTYAERKQRTPHTLVGHVGNSKQASLCEILQSSHDKLLERKAIQCQINNQLSVQCRTQDSFAQCIDQCGAGDRYHPDSTR